MWAHRLIENMCADEHLVKEKQVFLEAVSTKVNVVDVAKGIDIHGLPEKKDIVEKIVGELAKKKADAAGGTSLAIGNSGDGGASLIVPGNTNASNLAICPPPGVAGMDRGQDVVDYDQTAVLLQTLV